MKRAREGGVMKRAEATDALFDDIVKHVKHRWYCETIPKGILIAETAKKFNVAQGFVRGILRLIQVH